MNLARNIAASAITPPKDEKPGGICIACQFTVAKIQHGLCPAAWNGGFQKGRPNIETFKHTVMAGQ